jgi:eukaryotic-like serine/threonine-protein kinase
VLESKAESPMMDKDHQADASKPSEDRSVPGDVSYTPVTALHGPSNRAADVDQSSKAPYLPNTARFETPGPVATQSSEAQTTASPQHQALPRERPLNTESGDPLCGTPYRTMCRLGKGGMGEVFEAQDLEVGGCVVVKVLHENIAGAQFIDRMRLEAESLAALDHPNIVQVSRFSRTPSGLPYLAMERLYGRTLHEEILARGRMRVDEALDYSRQILAGLAAAHACGIVHRDIKPQNIFLCDNKRGRGTVKIVDFGLAKALSASPQNKGPAPLAYPTDTAMFVGTVRYAAPEQISNAGIDDRTDLYSFGLVLLTMLTGRAPFHDMHDRRDLLIAQLRQSALRRLPEGVDLPPRLMPVLEKLLAKKPQDRFKSAAEVTAALDAFANDDSESDGSSLTYVALSSADLDPGSACARPPKGQAVRVPSSDLHSRADGHPEPVEKAPPPSDNRRTIGPNLLFVAVASAAWFAFFTGLVLWWLRK